MFHQQSAISLKARAPKMLTLITVITTYPSNISARIEFRAPFSNQHHVGAECTHPIYPPTYPPLQRAGASIPLAVRPLKT